MKSKDMLKKVGTISCSVLLTAALAGGILSLANPTPAEANQVNLNQGDAAAQSLSNASENYIGEARAKEIALTHAGMNEADVSHMLCKLDYDDGIAEYEVEFWDGTTEYDYEINALTGDIIGYDYDMESYDAKPATSQTATASTDYIGETKAKSVALTHAGMNEADVSHMLCKLDYDDGIAEYEVEFWDGTTEYDYEINALTGDIIGYDYDMESYDAKPATSQTATASTDYIGETRAKEIAFAHAGVTESEATQIKCEFDFDDGYAEYEVEWEIGRMEYEYTISAVDGTIWEHDAEYDD